MPHPHPLLRALPAAILLWALALPVVLEAQSQPIDEAYTARIHEFTTEEFFLTPLVDHLPASETVPTPLDFLGYISGTRDVLTHTAEIYAYLRAVAEASPRVTVKTIGMSEEGREILLVAWSPTRPPSRSWRPTRSSWGAWPTPGEPRRRRRRRSFPG
jgi:hypothetical protein